MTIVANGSINSAPTGQPPFSYSWSTGDTVQNLSGLCAGNYFLTTTDSNGCVTTDTAVVEVVEQPTPPPVTIINATCNGCCDGTATANLAGGFPPFTYAWSCTGQTTLTVTGLCAGTCDVLVTDSMGCATFMTCTISQPPLSIEYLNFYSMVSIYPNPNTGQFTLEMDLQEETKLSIKLYHITGQMIYSKEIGSITGNYSMQTDLSGNPKGMYYLQVGTDNDLVTQKIIFH